MRKLNLFIFLAFFIFISCKKRKTSWDSNWILPVFSDSLNLNKYVNDSTIQSDGLGYYEVNLHRTLMNLDLLNIVKIPDTTIYQTYKISFNSLDVAPGTTFINPSSINENIIKLNDIQLKNVKIKNGNISVILKNPVATKCFFTITLPGVTKNNVTIQENFEAPAGTNQNPGIVEKNIDLSNCILDLRGINGSNFNILQSQVSVQTDPNGTTTTITKNDYFKVEATIKDIKTEYAKGYFGNKIFSDTTVTNIELLNKIIAGSIDLPSLNLKFNISNGCKIPIKSTITTIKNENYSGNSVELTNNIIGSPFYLDQATGSWNNFMPTKKTIEFNSNNSNIENFIENLGAKNSFGYSIQLNPWGNNSGSSNEIFSNSKINISIDGSLPLSIGTNGLTAVDTFNFDISQNPNKSHIKSGKLMLDARNSFPFSSRLTLSLVDENGTILHTLNSSEKIKSSVFGTNYNSIGLPYSISNLEFNLSETVVSDINKIRKIIVKTKLDSPTNAYSNNEIQKIPENASIFLSLKAAFILNNKY